MKNYNRSSLYRISLITLVLFAFGCSETKYLLKYEVENKDSQVWPNAPEIPRFKYVGELTGEQNFVEVKDSKGLFTQFGEGVKWLIGIKSHSKLNPVVLQRPQSGVTDENGRIYVTDVSRQAVFVFDETKGKLTIWDRALPEQGFKSPIGIALGSEGTVLVADADLGMVVRLDQDGNPVSNFGKGILNRPTGLARDPATGQIYVADTHDHDIKVFNDKGDLLDIIGQRGVDVGEFNAPTHLSFSKDRLYITDTLNTRVQILSRKGEFLTKFGRRGIFLGDLVRPKGIASDSDGNVYVIESFHDYLLVYDSDGQFLMPVGGSGSGAGQFYLPSGVWTDSKDRVFIADMFNGRVVILQYLRGSDAGQNTN